MATPRNPVVSQVLGLDNAVLLSHDYEVSQYVASVLHDENRTLTSLTLFLQTILATLAGTSLQLLHVVKGSARPGAVLLPNVTAVAASPHCQ